MNPNALKVAMVLLLIACSAGVLAARPQKPPPPEASQFDFWIGEWTVTNPAGKHAGDSVIQSINGGRALLENWTGADGKFEGKSLNTYDTQEKVWKQFWVDSSGGVLGLSGGLVDGSMVLSGKSVAADGSEAVERITWTPNGDGSVRQHWQQSTDGGATWKTVFDGHYVKKPAKPD